MQQKPTRRSRRSQNWSSSVLGTHASSRRPSHASNSSRQERVASAYGSRRRAASLRGRTAEVSQVRHATGNVSRGHVDPAQMLRDRRRRQIIRFAIVFVAIVALAVALGSCVFKGSVSSNFALQDDSVKSQLVTPENADEPYYVLVAGLADDSQKASYLALLRIDEANNDFSLLNIPANISVGRGTMLRDLPGEKDQGAVVSEVAKLTGVSIAHYMAITDEGFVAFVDALGGLSFDVPFVVDDPRASYLVLDPGEQTLSGEQTLALVSAYNYTDDRVTRARIQADVLEALSSIVTSRSGIEFMNAADALAAGVQTDLDYDKLEALSKVYASCDGISYGTIPGSSYASSGRTYFRVSTSSWEKVCAKFVEGKDFSSTFDEENVNRSGVSILVLNGTDIDGSAAKAKEALENAGYTVKDTGNADVRAYDETLVVYRTDDDRETAEAIVSDLGVGRAVSASTHYKLTTDIQVMVGKDWTS